MTTLTPYDDDRVLEPKLWIGYVDSRDHDNAEEDPERYGKVDFDNSEGASLVTGLRVIPNGEHGVIIEFGGVEDVTIRCLEPGATVTVAEVDRQLEFLKGDDLA